MSGLKAAAAGYATGVGIGLVGGGPVLGAFAAVTLAPMMALMGWALAEDGPPMSSVERARLIADEKERIQAMQGDAFAQEYLAPIMRDNDELAEFCGRFTSEDELGEDLAWEAHRVRNDASRWVTMLEKPGAVDYLIERKLRREGKLR